MLADGPPQHVFQDRSWRVQERRGPERKEASFDLRLSEKSATWIKVRSALLALIRGGHVL